MVISLLKYNEIKEIGINSLQTEQIEFLEKVGVIVNNSNPVTEDGIPVYIKIDNEMLFIYDYVLKDNKAFEKDRKDVAGGELLFRGGGVLIPVIGNQCVAIFDERHSWFRPIGGIAKFNEGQDLEMAAVREGVIEELLVSDSKEHNRIVPPIIGDTSTLSLAAHNWSMKFTGVAVVGSVTTSYTLNDENGAFECVVKWELPWSANYYKVFHQEDWFEGGPSGIVPVTLDKFGNITGYWSGRQGYVSLPVQKIHPTLQKFWLDA